MSSSIAIEVDGLRKRFGSVEALSGVSFGAETGIVHGLLGPNGAGKTTAVRSLFLGIPVGNDVWGAVAWTVGIAVVSATLAIWRYRRVVAK